jgi:YidC/Oxa1 family membrane protein insertase
MRPVNRWAERLQEDVRLTESRILPRLTEIKKAFKGAEQAERILALYKEEKVHPLYSLKGMAGVLVIIPVFIGAFNMLSENIWLSGESFLWIKDLSLPDAVFQLPIGIPFLGDTLNLLPFIMVIFSVIASVLRNKGEMDATLHARNQRNLVLMSLMFFLLFYTFPAGMVLYWVVNNAVSFVGSLVQRVRS